MKTIHIAFVLLFLITSSFSSLVSSHTPESCPFSLISNEKITGLTDIYQWADGKFSGSWTSTSSNLRGTIQGYLKQGRNPGVGSMSGTLSSEDQTLQRHFSGIFKGRLLLGVLSTDTSQTSVFGGILTGNTTAFYAHILNKEFGVLDCTGNHLDSFLPMLTGPYQVGVKSFHLIDESRPENFTQDNPDDVREMMVQLWYPVDSTFHGTRMDYMDAPTFDWLWGRSPVPLITIPDNAYTFVRPYSMNSPPLTEGSNPFPVLLFSPGYDGVYAIYTSLIEDLVSHGYVVASINHPYVSGITVFPDGRTVGLAPDFPGDYAIRTVVDDALFVLDFVTALNSTDSLWKGRLDLSKVGMFGHSFGGAATTICCTEDPRFKAGLTLDGVVYTTFLPESFDTPLLLMLAESRFDNGSSINALWDCLSSNAYKITVKGSSHYGYTDVGLLLRHFVPLIPSEPLGFGTIDAKRLINITKSYEIAFFNVYLKHEPLENLLELSSMFDEVMIDYK
jgi:pimeloyl-ACP methyl ester carboxylesterase